MEGAYADDRGAVVFLSVSCVNQTYYSYDPESRVNIRAASAGQHQAPIEAMDIEALLQDLVRSQKAKWIWIHLAFRGLDQ